MFPVGWCHILCLLPRMTSVPTLTRDSFNMTQVLVVVIASVFWQTGNSAPISSINIKKWIQFYITHNITYLPFVQDLLVAVKFTKNLLIYYWILMAHWIWSAATAVRTLSIFCGISSWLVLQILNSLDFCIINHQLLRKNFQSSLMWVGTEKRKHIFNL